MLNISKDDRVIDSLGRVGEVTSVYPEVNVVIVKLDSGEYEKMDINQVVRYRENVPESKKAGLLDKIKGVFK